MLIINKEVLKKIFSVFTFTFLIAGFIGIYIAGIIHGYSIGEKVTGEKFISFFKSMPEQKISFPSPTPTNIPTPTKKITRQLVANWGGPELWEEVNNRRVELGVNPLSQRDELCTIASIRLNELLELGKLDGHEGFSNLKERRSDLSWIFDKYSTLAEFLAFGGKTPEETVSLWEATLGHKKLMTGGEYVWGCIYAQNTFAVAITAF